MKKGLCLLMAAILFFSACAQEVDSSSSVSGTLLPTQVDHSLYPIRGGDLQMVTSNGGASQTAISSDGAYQLVSLTDGGMVLYYIDYASRVRTPLCPNPGCRHTDDTCPAWFSQMGGVLFMNSSKTRLFCITCFEFVTGTPDILWEISLDGMTRTKLFEFDFDQNFVDAVAASEDQLFFGLRYLEQGSTPKKVLCAFDLSRREAHSLFTYEDSAWLYGAFEHSLIILSFLPDSSQDAFVYSVYNLDTGEKSDPYRAGYAPDGRRSVTTTDQNFLYAINPTTEDHGNVSRIDLKSGEEVLLCEDLPFFDSDTSYIQFVLDGKIVADITDADPQTREISHYRYAVDCQNGQVTELTLSCKNGLLDEFLPILGSISPQDYLVISNYQEEEIVIPINSEESYTSQITVPQYAFLAKDDYWNNRANYLPVRQDL